MASITAATLTLQTRDWEVLTTSFNNSDTDFQELRFSLQNYYRAQGTYPQGTTTISIVITEDIVIKIFNLAYNMALIPVYKDVGASTINRILTALRATNNVADNYISTQLAIIDANVDLILTNTRKLGRRIILMKNSDGL